MLWVDFLASWASCGVGIILFVVCEFGVCGWRCHLCVWVGWWCCAA